MIKKIIKWQKLLINKRLLNPLYDLFIIVSHIVYESKYITLYYFVLYNACKSGITSLYITGEIKMDLVFAVMHWCA